MTSLSPEYARIIGIDRAAQHRVEELSKEIAMKQGMTPFEDVAALKEKMKEHAQAHRRITEKL
ncbi:MAG: hypothetical protein AAFR53_03065 [Pseudomonadota bacterium]